MKTITLILISLCLSCNLADTPPTTSQDDAATEDQKRNNQDVGLDSGGSIADVAQDTARSDTAEDTSQDMADDVAIIGPEERAKAAIVITDYKNYLNANRIPEGAIAVAYQGRLVDSAGVGRAPTDNAPVASLSKAITAVCTIKALELEGLDLSATLERVMPATLSSVPQADPRMKDITIGQLLQHNSGIQFPHLSDLGTVIPTLSLEQKLIQFRYISSIGLSAEPDSGYFYSNANYLILGLAIESLVKGDYETWCKSAVFEPLGIDTAQLSPLWTALTSFGGWEISPIDYLTFLNAYFKPDSMVGFDPQASESFIPIDNQRNYGLGTVFRWTVDGAIYWHAGSFLWQSAEQSGRFGAYYSIFPNGFSASVNLADTLEENRGSEIDQILYQLNQ